MDEALVRRVGDTDIFAELELAQKERIIRALKKSGNIVGYKGDEAYLLRKAQIGTGHGALERI